MAASKPKSSTRKKQSARRGRQSAKAKSKNPTPGQLALLEKNLPGRRFVEFPLVKGKTVEKVELFITSDCISLTLELQDKTALHLDLEPGLTINAELQQIQKGDVETLAEWPPIHSQT